MSKWVRWSLLSLFCLLFVTVGQADLRVNCRSGNCLQDGASVFNSVTKVSGEVSCVRDDCGRNGFVYSEKRVPVLDTVCNGDCVRSGFNAYDSKTGKRLFNLWCDGFSCLEEGWTLRYESGEVYESKCRFGDCNVWGWSTFDRAGKKISDTNCFGNCLEGGWSTKALANSKD